MNSVKTIPNEVKYDYLIALLSGKIEQSTKWFLDSNQQRANVYKAL
ncbi:hypothetical protein Q4574_04650 [Aliiglaciecola sp. 3_MG-2023]|nr:hypothetical protein [Aliiglaciecola sp. 3_MG-2023]MDO6692561.1 hypothetical protein [Aliiglaciecola sp. 3_MG-2023]